MKACSQPFASHVAFSTHLQRYVQVTEPDLSSSLPTQHHPFQSIKLQVRPLQGSSAFQVVRPTSAAVPTIPSMVLSPSDMFRMNQGSCLCARGQSFGMANATLCILWPPSKLHRNEASASPSSSEDELQHLPDKEAPDYSVQRSYAIAVSNKA